MATNTTNDATSSQDQQEKQLSLHKQLRQEVDHVRDGMRKTAMARSFRALTTLLGKLNIGRDKFVTDNDALFASMPVMPRPPFRRGIQYGLGLAESVAWTKRYLAAGKASTAVAALSSVGVDEDKPGSV